MAEEMTRERALELLKRGKRGVAEWNAWRESSGKHAPDLSKANLQRTKLAKADLQMADLSGANLSGAWLRDADLRGARLSGANLSDADLSEANLRAFHLSGADLRGARLNGVVLRGGNLNGADLAGATVSRSVFDDLDLAQAHGLGEVNHLGASTIGTHALAASKGRIPDVFLRGCGLSDWEIEAAKLYNPELSGEQRTTIVYKIVALQSSQPIQFFSVFLSHNHEDKPFVRKLYDALQERGIRCWLDEKQMKPGDDIHEQVDRGIRHWDKLLLCASKKSLTSWWVDSEITKAFVKEQRLFKERGKKVLALVPLNLDGHLFEYDGAKADELRSRIAADFTDEARFDAEVTRLVEALRADGGGREELPPALL